jgi:uncharacterized membrane protein
MNSGSNALDGTRGSSRVGSVDALRGAIMIIMALDHTRDLIHFGAMSFSPEDLARTYPLLFFTRWVTHICAPTFMFLAGVGAFFRLQADGSPARLSRFLWTRGVWLVILEVTIMRLALNLSFDLANPILLLVLTALGASMIALGALLYLPRRALLAVCVTMIVLHNTLDGVVGPATGWRSGLWHFLHQPGFFVLGGLGIVVAYPVIPWIAVMAAGFLFGPVLRLDLPRRRRILCLTGAALVVGFILLRAMNIYGDPQRWSTQATATLTALSFLRTTKYPPSLLFLMMTLGPALLGLAFLDGREGRLQEGLKVIGRVPLFFYVVHFWAIRAVGAALAFGRYGQRSLQFLAHPLPSTGGTEALYPPDFGYSLPVVYLVWIGVVLTLYPLCRWFSGLKQRRSAWWLSYL